MLILHPKFQKFKESVHWKVVHLITVDMATIVIIVATRVCMRHVIGGPMWRDGDDGDSDAGDGDNGG